MGGFGSFVGFGSKRAAANQPPATAAAPVATVSPLATIATAPVDGAEVNPKQAELDRVYKEIAKAEALAKVGGVSIGVGGTGGPKERVATWFKAMSDLNTGVDALKSKARRLEKEITVEQAATAKAGVAAEAQDDAWNALQSYASLRAQQGEPLSDDDYFAALPRVQGGEKWESIAKDLFSADKGSKKTARLAPAKIKAMVGAGYMTEEEAAALSPEEAEVQFGQFQTQHREEVAKQRQDEKIAASAEQHRLTMEHQDTLATRHEEFERSMKGGKVDPRLKGVYDRQMKQVDQYLSMASSLRASGKSEEADNYVRFATNAMHDAEQTQASLESGATTEIPKDVEAKAKAIYEKMPASQRDTPEKAAAARARAIAEAKGS